MECRAHRTSWSLDCAAQPFRSYQQPQCLVSVGILNIWECMYLFLYLLYVFILAKPHASCSQVGRQLYRYQVDPCYMMYLSGRAGTTISKVYSSLTLCTRAMVLCKHKRLSGVVMPESSANLYMRHFPKHERDHKALAFEPGGLNDATSRQGSPRLIESNNHRE